MPQPSASAKKKTNPGMITPMFRGSFVHLVTPRAQSDEPGAEAKYSLLMPFSKTDKACKQFLADLEKELMRVAVAKHGAEITKKKLKHFPIKDGDETDYDSLHGCFTVGASNKFRPGCIEPDGHGGHNILTTEQQLYSGAWYRAKVSCYAWFNKKSGKGVSVSLENVIKVKDDDAFTGRSKAEDDFADLLGEKPENDDLDDDASDAKSDDLDDDLDL